MRMNKLIKKLTIVAVIATLGISLIACKGNNGDKSSASKSALDKEELIVGLDDTFVPMGFKDESGNIVGFDVELANAVGKS